MLMPDEARTRARLSHQINVSSLSGDSPIITSDKLKEYVGKNLPSIGVQISNLLRWAAHELGDDQLGALELPDLDHLAARVGVVDGERVFDLVSLAERKGLIRFVPDDCISLTIEGWAHVEEMMKDKLTFVKSDGRVIKENVQGRVVGGQIFTFDDSLPIEPNDRFLRSLPSGVVEEFIIEDPGYSAGLGEIKPHFQSAVRRSDQPVAPPSTIINNIKGANARVNIHSTDNSKNISIDTDNSALFEGLRERILSSGLAEHQIAPVRAAIDEMERAHGTDRFGQTYVNFMSVAADHLAVFGPLLAGLASLLL